MYIYENVYCVIYVICMQFVLYPRLIGIVTLTNGTPNSHTHALTQHSNISMPGQQLCIQMRTSKFSNFLNPCHALDTTKTRTNRENMSLTYHIKALYVTSRICAAIFPVRLRKMLIIRHLTQLAHINFLSRN